MEGTWNFCGISVDDLLVQPITDNISRLYGTTIMIIILFIMNIFSLISTLSLKKSLNLNVKKRVFKKPVKKEYKDVEIQMEDYVEPVSTRPSKIKQKQATLLYPVTIKKIRHDRDAADVQKLAGLQYEC